MTDRPDLAPGAPAREAHPSLFRRLMLWGAVGVIVAAAAAALAVAERTATRAEDEQARLLREVTGVVARVEAGRRSPAALSMDEEAFAATYLQENGETPAGSVVLVRTLEEGGAALRIALDETLPDGLHTIEIDDEAWRVHMLTLRNGRHLAVGQRLTEMEAASREAVLQAVVPVVLGAVVMLLLGALVISRAGRPVRALAASIEARSPESAEPLAAEGVPSEVMPLVTAVNDLLARVEVLRRREARFAADAAHELRTPLTALKLEAERLEREDLSDVARASLAAITRGIERLGRLVEQLLTLQRAQLARDAQEAPSADLLDALGEAVTLVWDEVDRRGIDFEAVGFDVLDDPATAPVTLPVSPDALTGLLRNLIENAVRYSPEGASVRVRLVNTMPLTLEISDDGPGIPEELLSRATDPFFRVPGTGVAGTGLGLAIARETAQKAGLTLTLINTHPGLTVRLSAEA